MDRGHLEAKVIAGARAKAAAPLDVSAELRATAQAETDMRIMAGQAQVKGEDPAFADQAAEVLSGKRGNLEARNEEYEAWSESTTDTRDLAGKARKELQRRGHEMPTWIPEDESSKPEPDESESRAEVEWEIEADAPKAEAGEPEASPEAAEDVERGIEPEPAEPGAV
jgi:hypothetical protein